MPNLLPQKPSKNSKAKDYLKAVERRMQSWFLWSFFMREKRTEEINERRSTKINERRYWKHFEEVCSFNEERKYKCCY